MIIAARNKRHANLLQGRNHFIHISAFPSEPECSRVMVMKKMKKYFAVGRIRTYAPRGKLISSQSP